MIFQKNCQSIQIRRRPRQNVVDKKVKPSTTSDETETVVASSSDNSIGNDNSELIEECFPQNTPHHHHDERKERIISSMQDILQNLRQERNVCQMELNDVMKQSNLLNSVTDTSCSDHDDSNNEQSLCSLHTEMDLIQKSIAELIELQYCIENIYKTKKQIRKMEKAFNKYIEAK